MQDPTGPEVSVRDWLDAAAAKQATPGGGSVAALAGALAAAMGEMTLNYSVGRKANTPEQDALLAENLAELTRARDLLLRLMAEDQHAYAALVAARKLDDSDPVKTAKVDAATVAAIRIPQAIMATGLAILTAAGRVAPEANRWLLSDLAVCCELALATVRCGAYNVRANLADLTAEDAERLMRETDEHIARGVDLLRGTLEAIASRQQA